jgi:hypothetical protein
MNNRNEIEHDPPLGMEIDDVFVCAECKKPADIDCDTAADYGMLSGDGVQVKYYCATKGCPNYRREIGSEHADHPNELGIEA